MAATYEPIATTTLGSATATYTFSSIPSTYTDLIVVINSKRVNAGTINIYMRINGDTGNNYSDTFIYGTGSGRNSNGNYAMIGDQTNSFSTTIVQFMNYANTNTYKTSLFRFSDATDNALAGVNLWRSTSAINSLTFSFAGSDNFAAGSTFTLYGIKAA